MGNEEKSGEQATDVLAAEEFGVPAPDPALRREDLRLPSDLVGGEARDVLVAEEFAMPAPDEARVRPPAGRRASLVMRLGAPLLVGVVWLRRRARSKRRNGEG